MTESTAATVSYQGVEYPLVSKKGAWSTIIINGKETKVRIKNAKSARTSKARKQPTKRAAPRKERAITGNRLVDADLAGYVTTEIKTKSGRKSVDVNDKVAVLLRGKDLDDVYKIASEKTGLTQKDLHGMYDKLNPGMQRMNLGNRIRGALNGQ